MMTSIRWWLTPSLLALTLVACGPGTAAKALRPDMPDADEALGSESCTEASQDAQPWVVDMPATQRNALKAAMKRGIAVVSYDCKELKILRHCKVKEVPVSYEYVATGINKDVQRFEDEDEVRASLSGGAVIAAKIGAEMQRGTKLDIAYALLGETSTTVPVIAKSQLDGKCDGATHFVAVAYLGAFMMKKSTEASAGVVLEVFQQGGSASSNSAAAAEASSGRAAACEKGANDKAEVGECDFPVQVELTALTEKAEEGAAVVPPAPELRPPPPCRDGTVRVGRSCVSETRAPARTCTMGNYADCTKQCDAGSAGSCAIVGFMYEKGKGVRADAKKAFSSYERACNAKDVDGCTGMAFLLSKGEGVAANPKRATDLLKPACASGNGRACSGLGHQERIAKRLDEAIRWLDRGCKLRYVRACYYAGALQMQSKQDKEAYSSFIRACFGSDNRGCLSAAYMNTSKRAPKPNDKMQRMYESRGLRNLQSGCAGKDAEACEVLGDWYSGKYDPAVRDPAKAKSYYQKSCQGGNEDACETAGSSGPPGPPGPPKGPPKGPPQGPPKGPPGPPKPPR